MRVTKISLRETSKLLEESRRIAEHETEDDSSSIFLKMILQIVMAMDERMKKNSMTNISEIKDAITSVVARVGDLVD